MTLDTLHYHMFDKIVDYLDTRDKNNLRATSLPMHQRVVAYAKRMDPQYGTRIYRAHTRYTRDSERKRIQVCMRTLTCLTLPCTVPALAVAFVASLPASIFSLACCTRSAWEEYGPCLGPTVPIIHTFRSLFYLTLTGERHIYERDTACCDSDVDCCCCLNDLDV